MLWVFRRLAVFLMVSAMAPAHAVVGMTSFPSNEVSGPVLVFYPAQSDAKLSRVEPLGVKVAVDGQPVAGNGKLVVISRVEGGNAWYHWGLTRALVEAGFFVALPEHTVDRDMNTPSSLIRVLRRRPFEISRALDRLSVETLLAGRVDFWRVGVFGVSLGGHTALVLAGGRWSNDIFNDHCTINEAEDRGGCTESASRALLGGPVYLALYQRARQMPRMRPAYWIEHTDPRVVAVVAGVPFVAGFDLHSLRQPKPRVGLVRADLDAWLPPRFHVDAVRDACDWCERLPSIEHGGHGALLEPISGTSTATGKWADPSGFDRGRELPKINAAIVDFFQRSLIKARP